MNNKSLLFIFLISFLRSAHLQTYNPCPDKFTFNRERNQPGRWFGTVSLVYDTELSGVWLRLKFDRPVIQLGVSMLQLLYNKIH